MKRSLDAGAGFRSRSAFVNSSRLTQAVAASLAFGSLALCVIVVLTLATTRLSVAMPL